MNYEVKILADSIGDVERGIPVRLTTFQLTYPRFIHSELMTHRVFSRNAASSRAIPTEKNIERVRKNSFVPETFNKRVKGMGVGEAYKGWRARLARFSWIAGSKGAAVTAWILNKLDVDKSRVNRILEPFLWMTTIVSSTEWENFYGLRVHPAAQPEFRIIAELMQTTMAASTPAVLKEGEWHLPLISESDLEKLCSYRDHEACDSETFANYLEKFKLVSAGRCARVSYDTHENFETPEASINRAIVLKGNGHFSPFEHIARPFDQGEATGVRSIQSEIQSLRDIMGNELTEILLEQVEFCGNFRGFVQMRKEVPFESNFSEAIKEEVTA